MAVNAQVGIEIFLAKDGDRILKLLEKQFDKLDEKSKIDLEVNMTDKSKNAIQSINGMLNRSFSDVQDSFQKVLGKAFESTNAKDFEKSLVNINNLMKDTKRYMTKDMINTMFKNTTPDHAMTLMRDIQKAGQIGVGKDKKEMTKEFFWHELENAFSGNPDMSKAMETFISRLERYGVAGKIQESLVDAINGIDYKGILQDISTQSKYNKINELLNGSKIDYDGFDKLELSIENIVDLLYKLKQLDDTAGYWNNISKSERLLTERNMPGLKSEYDPESGYVEFFTDEYRAQLSYILQQMVGDVDSAKEILSKIMGKDFIEDPDNLIFSKDWDKLLNSEEFVNFKDSIDTWISEFVEQRNAIIIKDSKMAQAAARVKAKSKSKSQQQLSQEPQQQLPQNAERIAEKSNEVAEELSNTSNEMDEAAKNAQKATQAAKKQKRAIKNQQQLLEGLADVLSENYKKNRPNRKEAETRLKEVTNNLKQMMETGDYSQIEIDKARLIQYQAMQNAIAARVPQFSRNDIIRKAGTGILTPDNYTKTRDKMISFAKKQGWLNTGSSDNNIRSINGVSDAHQRAAVSANSQANAENRVAESERKVAESASTATGALNAEADAIRNIISEENAERDNSSSSNVNNNLKEQKALLENILELYGQMTALQNKYDSVDDDKEERRLEKQIEKKEEAIDEFEKKYSRAIIKTKDGTIHELPFDYMDSDNEEKEEKTRSLLKDMDQIQDIKVISSEMESRIQHAEDNYLDFIDTLNYYYGEDGKLKSDKNTDFENSWEDNEFVLKEFEEYLGNIESAKAEGFDSFFDIDPTSIEKAKTLMEQLKSNAEVLDREWNLKEAIKDNGLQESFDKLVSSEKKADLEKIFENVRSGVLSTNEALEQTKQLMSSIGAEAEVLLQEEQLLSRKDALAKASFIGSNDLPSLPSQIEKNESSLQDLFKVRPTFIKDIEEEISRLETSLKPVHNMIKELSKGSSIKNIPYEEYAKKALELDKIMGAYQNGDSNVTITDYAKAQLQFYKLFETEMGHVGGVKNSGAKNKSELRQWIMNSWREDLGFERNDYSIFGSAIDAIFGSKQDSLFGDDGKKKTLFQFSSDLLSDDGFGFLSEISNRELQEYKRVLDFIKTNGITFQKMPPVNELPDKNYISWQKEQDKLNNDREKQLEYQAENSQLQDEVVLGWKEINEVEQNSLQDKLAFQGQYNDNNDKISTDINAINKIKEAKLGSAFEEMVSGLETFESTAGNIDRNKLNNINEEVEVLNAMREANAETIDYYARWQPPAEASEEMKSAYRQSKEDERVKANQAKFNKQAENFNQEQNKYFEEQAKQKQQMLIKAEQEVQKKHASDLSKTIVSDTDKLNKSALAYQENLAKKNNGEILSAKNIAQMKEYEQIQARLTESLKLFEEMAFDNSGQLQVDADSYNKATEAIERYSNAVKVASESVKEAEQLKAEAKAESDEQANTKAIDEQDKKFGKDVENIEKKYKSLLERANAYETAMAKDEISRTQADRNRINKFDSDVAEVERMTQALREQEITSAKQESMLNRLTEAENRFAETRQKAQREVQNVNDTKNLESMIEKYQKLTNMERDYRSAKASEELDIASSKELKLIQDYENTLSEIKQLQEQINTDTVDKTSESWERLLKSAQEYGQQLIKLDQEKANNIYSNASGVLSNMNIEGFTKGQGEVFEKAKESALNAREELKNILEGVSNDSLKNLYHTDRGKYDQVLNNIIETAGKARKALIELEIAENDTMNLKGTSGVQKAISDIDELLNANKISASHSKALKEIKETLSGDYINNEQFSKAKEQIHQIGEEMKSSGEYGRTFGDVLKQRFQSLAAYLSTFVSFYAITGKIREMVDVVHQLDDAFTEMRKVSDESATTLKAFQEESFDLAKGLGTDAISLQNSTADFMRLGQSLEEAKDSAMAANVLMNVSEFDNISEATDSLIAMKAAYKDLGNMDIIDKLNEVGNNMPIATAGLATALQDSASALTTAGNSIDESIALITAGNAITQDPSKTGGILP